MCKVHYMIVVAVTVFILFPFVSLYGEPRTVRVGIFQAAPLVMVKDGDPDGLFIDLIEYFSKTLDWRVQYVEGTWNELLVQLKKGEIDLLPAVGYSRERVLKYDFSRNPVYIDSGVLFTSPKFTLNTIFDLKEKRVAAVRGSIFTEGFIDYISSFGIHCEIIATNDNKDVMRAISNGEVDAGVCIYSLGNELAHEYPVVITPISFTPIALEFAVPKGRNGDLISEIDRLMQNMIGDPNSFYSRSFHKWTIPKSSNELPVWIWWGIIGLFGLGLFMALWTFFLKKQVQLKTKYLEKEIAERKQAEKVIQESLAEKETLIRELYHRTKNTMQVIHSMVVLQAVEYPANEELQKLVKNTESRIQAISLVHQMLYKSQNLSRISIQKYVQELTALIFQGFGVMRERISLKLDIEDRYFLLDTAIPFGLILNELMTNSLKYAFPDDRKGSITITLTENQNDIYLFRYSDDGIGVPEAFDFKNKNTLGIKLINSIGEMQLKGNVVFEHREGVQCMMEFSSNLYKKRV
jgi:two-component sensor histidine kinase/ABC-type amino acid transport substrate-binding protein